MKKLSLRQLFLEDNKEKAKQIRKNFYSNPNNPSYEDMVLANNLKILNQADLVKIEGEEVDIETAVDLVKNQKAKLSQGYEEKGLSVVELELI